MSGGSFSASGRIRSMGGVEFISSILRTGFLGPVSADVNVPPREPQFEEDKEQVVNDNAYDEQLPGPDTAAIVPLQAINQSKRL